MGIGSLIEIGFEMDHRFFLRSLLPVLESENLRLDLGGALGGDDGSGKTLTT